MRCINNGETPITELAGFISSLFGIEIKDCYSAYVDMKRRKNDSCTYSLDKMRERLNRTAVCNWMMNGNMDANNSRPDKLFYKTSSYVV